MEGNRLVNAFRKFNGDFKELADLKKDILKELKIIRDDYDTKKGYCNTSRTIGNGGMIIGYGFRFINPVSKIASIF